MKKAARVVKSSEEIDALLAEVEEELAAAGESPIVDEQAPPPSEEEAVPAHEEKPAPKAEEEGPAKLGADAVEIKDLAQELDLDPKAIRKWLRNSGKTKPTGGRWAWAPSDPQLVDIKKGLASLKEEGE